MKFKLINQPNKCYSTVEQILINRGIAQQDVKHYLNLNDNDINDYKLFGQENLKQAAITLISAIKNNKQTCVIIDSDCDGLTSSALLINYLYSIFPTWVTHNLSWGMHDGKQHGLKDCIDNIEQKKFALVICPDSASNDYDEHKRIKDYGGNTIVLDHHLANKISEDAIIINNQLSDYPNKELSGVGVVWQFCRYLDNLLGYNNANKFLDLVALGLCADMMSLHSFETRYLITKGFRKENIHNPFIEGMIEKNSFPLTKSDYISADEEMACTSMGAAFFIVPFVNAMTRSGTAAEKELLFESMLESAAYTKVLSNKRGHKQGEMQTLLAQALRTVTNVKNRQTRAEDAGMSLLESKIKENNLLNHKILLFLLNPNEIEPNIRGLVANKMMAKYQRPCLVLSKTPNNTYEGSGRGYTKTGIDSFKNILEKCNIPILYVQGHDNAFGFGIEEELIPSFIEQTDMLLKDVSTEPLYRIDYDLKETDQCQQIILDIAELNDLWGQDVERSFVNMNFKITTTNFELMKSNTLKFTLPNGVSLIKFNGSEDEIETFSLSSGYIEVNAICKCNANKWNGNVYPQLMIEDYEIVNVAKYIF